MARGGPSTRRDPPPQAGTRFVFVPGQRDPGAAEVLPRPPLPPYFTEKLLEEIPSAVFASNPCRVPTPAPHATAGIMQPADALLAMSLPAHATTALAW